MKKGSREPMSINVPSRREFSIPKQSADNSSENFARCACLLSVALPEVCRKYDQKHIKSLRVRSRYLSISSSSGTVPGRAIKNDYRGSPDYRPWVVPLAASKHNESMFRLSDELLGKIFSLSRLLPAPFGMMY